MWFSKISSCTLKKYIYFFFFPGVHLTLSLFSFKKSINVRMSIKILNFKLKNTSFAPKCLKIYQKAHQGMIYLIPLKNLTYTTDINGFFTTGKVVTLCTIVYYPHMKKSIHRSVHVSIFVTNLDSNLTFLTQHNDNRLTYTMG